jgi:hypothetical protein
MFSIWRVFVVWLRTLLLAWMTKKPIDWHKEIDEVLDIAKKVNDKTKDPTKPINMIPDYDMVGTTKFRLRDLFKKFRKKQ